MSTNVNKNIVKKQTVVAQNNSSNKQTAAQSTNATAKKASTMTVASIIDNLKTGKTSVAQATVDLRNLGASVTSKKVGDKTTLTIKSAGKSYVVTTNSVKISKVVMQPTKTVESIVNDLKLGKITVEAATKDLKALGATVSTRKSAAKTVVTVRDSKGKSFSVTTNSNMANAHVTTKIDNQPKITDDPICPGVPTVDYQNEMANIENIVKNFIEGKIKIATAKSFLMQNGATDIKQTDSNGYTTISFTHRGKSYSMTCSQIAAQDSATNFVELEGKISLTGDAKVTKTSYTEQELKNVCSYPEIIDKYFYVALKKDGEIEAYALKDGFTYGQFLSEAVTTKLTKQNNTKKAHLEILEELFKEIGNDPNKQLLFQLSCHYGVNITSTEGLSESVIKSLKSQFINIDEIKNILTNMVNSSNYEEPLNKENLITSCFARFKSSNIQLHYQVNQSADQILSSPKFQNYLKENELDTSDMDVYKEALFALVSHFEEGTSCPPVDKLTDMLITFMEEGGHEIAQELIGEFNNLLEKSLGNYFLDLKAGDRISFSGLKASIMDDLYESYKVDLELSDQEALELAKKNIENVLPFDDIEKSPIANLFLNCVADICGTDDTTGLLGALLNEGVLIKDTNNSKHAPKRSSAMDQFIAAYGQVDGLAKMYSDPYYTGPVFTHEQMCTFSKWYWEKTDKNITPLSEFCKIGASAIPYIAQVDAFIDIIANTVVFFEYKEEYGRNYSETHWDIYNNDPKKAANIAYAQTMIFDVMQLFNTGLITSVGKLLLKNKKIATGIIARMLEALAAINLSKLPSAMKAGLLVTLELVQKYLQGIDLDNVDNIRIVIENLTKELKSGLNLPDDPADSEDKIVDVKVDSNNGIITFTIDKENGNKLKIETQGRWTRIVTTDPNNLVIGRTYYSDNPNGTYSILNVGKDPDGAWRYYLQEYGDDYYNYRENSGIIGPEGNASFEQNGVKYDIKVDPKTGKQESFKQTLPDGTIIEDTGDKVETEYPDGTKEVLNKEDGSVEYYDENGALIKTQKANGEVVHSSKYDPLKYAESYKYFSDTQYWWNNGYSNSIGFDRFQSHLDAYNNYVYNGGGMSFDEWHSSTYGNSESDALSRYWQYIASSGGAGGTGVRGEVEAVKFLDNPPIFQVGSVRGTVVALKNIVESAIGFSYDLENILTEAVTRFFNAGYTADDLLTIESKTNKDEALYGDFIRVCKEIKSRNEILEDCGWNRAITIGKISGNTHFAIIPDGNGGYKYDVRNVQPINVQPKFDSSATQKLDFQKETF